MDWIRKGFIKECQSMIPNETCQYLYEGIKIKSLFIRIKYVFKCFHKICQYLVSN